MTHTVDALGAPVVESTPSSKMGLMGVSELMDVMGIADQLKKSYETAKSKDLYEESFLEDLKRL